jgi:hypothetical protein
MLRDFFISQSWRGKKMPEKKDAWRYVGITPNTILEKTTALEQGERQQFLENFLLHLVLKQEREAAVLLLKHSADAWALDEKAADDLKKWIEK